ncbi:unnamed protein product [Bursaphelenchus xylophilus]|uniref:(pine wood nematode) hypothetical protein n=1 Tax=Bursaphelenchus xylophilus TaxID=6326 RepID=A0A1I7RW85_BURXY|nr:unnamed protein product [Bursaphelenchus xylophilus]CAG9095267.1 unnamed protein product [Bursaphelenchus xylophilus]
MMKEPVSKIELAEFPFGKDRRSGKDSDAYEVLEGPYGALEAQITSLVLDEHYYYLGLSGSTLDGLVLERQALKHKVYVELMEGKLEEELLTLKYRPEFYLFCVDVMYQNGLPVNKQIVENLRKTCKKIPSEQIEQILSCLDRVEGKSEKDKAEEIGIEFISCDR